MSGYGNQTCAEERYYTEAEINAMSKEDLLLLYKATGSEELRWPLALRYVGLVKSIALQVRGVYSSFAQVDDIVNEGVLALVGAVAICAIQPLGLTEVLFETFSAIGTAGMTMGITRELLPLSRMIIVFLMYCGRVGSISFAVALLEKRAIPPVTLPREDITIG